MCGQELDESMNVHTLIATSLYGLCSEMAIHGRSGTS